MLDSHSPLPLYHQLKARIIYQIETGKWRPGDRVPSELELGEQFQVSRTTVRQAVGTLVNQGLLLRVKGKGTFVAQPRIQQSLAQLTSFSQDMERRGMRPGARVLQLDLAPAADNVAFALGLAPGEPVIVLKRMRLADQQAMSVETSHLHYPRCREVLTQDFSHNSLYRFLIDRLHILPTRARQQLEAIPCPPVEAGLLAIRKHSPVLHILRTTYDAQGSPFEQVESYYRGDRYTFQVDLVNEPAVMETAGSFTPNE